MLSLVLFLCSPHHHPLHLVEQVFPDDWLEASGEKFPVNAHHPVVDMILQKFLNAGYGQRLAAQVTQSYFRKSLPERIEGMVASCVEFKCFADEWRFLRVMLDIPSLGVIDVPNGSKRWPFASAQLLPDSALYVLGKIIHVVLRLRECDGEHELSLWRVLECHRREFEILEFARVQHMDDAPSVYGVPCKSVWMPRQNALGFSLYEGIQHFREHGSPGFFGSFCLLEGGDDFQSFFCGKFTKLSDLSFDGKSLSLFTLRGFSSIEDVLHVVMVSKKFAVGARMRERAALGAAPRLVCPRKSRRIFDLVGIIRKNPNGTPGLRLILLRKPPSRSPDCCPFTGHSPWPS